MGQDPLLTAIYVILGSAFITLFVYLISQVQMNGWLRAFEHFFDKKFTEYSNKNKNNERQQKE
jgi:hypothetical protein